MLFMSTMYPLVPILLRWNKIMRLLILGALLLSGLLFLPSHLVCWEVLGIVCFVPVVGLIFASVLCRVLYGVWPK